MSLDRLFYPKSIAVVGASPKLSGVKLPYFQILKMVGFKGELYPVNPNYEEIEGVRAYPSIDDLPEGIDLAIVGTPAQRSLKVVKAAARRKIKFLHFYTSGFGEGGNNSLELELVDEARKGGIRIVGPNCIGIHSPEAGVSFNFAVKSSIPGDVAFFSQSGGATSNFVSMAISRKIGLNKVISYGNQIDIRAEEYLEYFAKDKKIRFIACYVEDIKEPRAFLKALKEATETKPVAILKGGMTKQGAKAAASHTGALASDHQIWASAIRQHGGILVENFEQLLDLVLIGSSSKTPKGARMGFLGAGGGAAVSFTDLAILAGLVLPELQKTTQEIISEKIDEVNTSTVNPVDLGMYGFDFNVMAHTIKALGQDKGIDVIIPYFSIDYISTFQSDQIESGPHAIIEAANSTGKSVVSVLSKFTEDNIGMEKARISIYSSFRDAGLPVYATIQDAIYSIKRYLEWVKT